MVGMRPIIEFMTWNFSLVAYDQVVNSAAKIFQMSGGQANVPVVFRGPNGAAENLGSQHSTAVESLYAHFPGLKVVTYCDSHDAYGLLKAAIRDDNPVCFLESELTYGVKGEVPDEEYVIPLGQANIRKAGKDVTILTWGKQLFNVEKAAEQLAAEGIDAEIVDLRSLRPLDHETVFNSVVKTGRAVVIHEGFLYGCRCGDYRPNPSLLRHPQGPVLRVANRDVPQPYTTNLEKLVVPNPERIVQTVRQVMER